MTEAKSFRKQVLSLLGETYGDKTLVLCPTVFVRLLGGDHKAAILLSQILYWSDKTKDPDGWFYKSYADWQTETGLSEAQVRRIVNGDPRVKGHAAYAARPRRGNAAEEGQTHRRADAALPHQSAGLPDPSARLLRGGR